MTNFINKMFKDHFNVPDFETVKIPDRAYVELYNQVLKKGAGEHTVETTVGKYNLSVDVVVTIHEKHTTGGSDDYGNREQLNLSSYEVRAEGFCMEDDKGGINCNFSIDDFENMFT